ncbi:MAG: fibrillarin-like rRNA/tRNA 2'-O-methyltransferase [Halobacteriaceae archaeon]
MDLPEGITTHNFDGDPSIATQGPPVYGEPTDNSYRKWVPHRSKLGAMLALEMNPSLSKGDTVLYLGAANGTTVSHIADFAGPVYAIEFAPRPMRELIDVSETRENIIPLLKDARDPESYMHIVENEIDVIVQDVATTNQVDVARKNQVFLANDGTLILSLKARSEDITKDPEVIFESALDSLSEDFTVETTQSLEPYHDDHLGVIAHPP